MHPSPRVAALRTLLLAAIAASPSGCGDDSSPGGTSAGGTSAGGTSAGGAGSAAGAGGSGTSGQAGTPATATCIPGLVASCPCPGSEKSGVQTCQANGTFGECQKCPAGGGGSGSTGGASGASGQGGGSVAGGTAGTGGTAGQGGAAGESGAAGQGGGASGSGGTPAKFPCLDPQPVVVSGQDTGYVSCSSGLLARREVVACPVTFVPSTKACTGAGGECKTDADCQASPYGTCEESCYCFYPYKPCASDGDCPGGEICLCGGPYNSCTQATCTSSADCAVGDCMQKQYCGAGYGFRCQTAQDACQNTPDCSSGACILDGTDLVCGKEVCEVGVPGRPLRIEATLRQADLVRGAGW